MKPILLTIILFLLLQLNNAAIIYVTENGSGSLNGTSWANAYPGTSLQLAINSANSGDQIWVAAGTYLTTTGTDRSIAFSMKNGVGIFGSFAGTEIVLSQRNISCGPSSHLSGNIGTASVTDNSYKVMQNTMLPDTSAILDGFIISGGYDERAPNISDGLGGGIYNDGSNGGVCNPMIRNCVIRNNQAEFGAGIFNSGYNGGSCYPTFENCVVVFNHATGGGGGIDNFGLLNGAVYPTIINTLIANNSADDAAGGMYCWGGSNGLAGATLLNVTLVNNTVVNGNGGGIVLDNSNGGAGAGGTSGYANVSIFSSILWGNSANNGPQFYLYATGFATAYYSDIDTAYQSGNVLTVGSSNNIISNPLFSNPTLPIGIDGCWMTNDDGYQLQLGSACINAGVSNGSIHDLAFNDRIQGTSIDIGAYEFNETMGTNQNISGIVYKLFPNPAISEITIQADETISNILCYNSIGKIVSIKLDDNRLDISDLTNGMYHIIVTTKTNRQGIYSFIKQ